jgi:hypothetical protein
MTLASQFKAPASAGAFLLLKEVAKAECPLWVQKRE